MAAFFENNREILLFVYGLVFFVLGLAIALHSRHYSRLELARSLTWLAAFGLLHGVYEWGSLFIPIQSQHITAEFAHLFRVLQIIVLSLSYLFLFEFGIALLHIPRRIPHVYSLALFIVWLVVWLPLLRPLIDDTQSWYRYGNALARYFIAFPGAILSAYGVYRHTQKYIRPLNVPHLLVTFRIASLTLLLYGILSGLIPPPINSFPGNMINTDTFQLVFGFPVLLVRSAIGLVLAVTFIRGLEVFDIETARMIETIEQQQIVTLERERIGRELHDGALQTVYTAGLLVESAARLASPGSAISERLDKSVVALQDAITTLRGYMTELRLETQCVPLEEALGQLVTDRRFSSFLEIRLQCDLHNRETLSSQATEHLIAILREAISNTIRHADAQLVQIDVWADNEKVHLGLQDDGVGLPEQLRSGYGMRNMHDRARLLGGKLLIENANEKGTRISLIVPLKGV